MSKDKTSGNQSDDQAEAVIEENGAGSAKSGAKFEITRDGEQEQPETAPLDEAGEINLGEALQRLEEAEDVIRKHQDDVLRVQAEMQNLRRRNEQDIEKAHKYGQERFVTELLTVIDNLERALEAARVSKDESEDENAGGSAHDKLMAIHEGVDLTLKSFTECFRKFDIQAIDPLGEPFDPLQHQAMAAQENDKVEPNTVTAVMQKGYLLHGRVIRPAMVMVSK